MLQITFFCYCQRSYIYKNRARQMTMWVSRISCQHCVSGNCKTNDTIQEKHWTLNTTGCANDCGMLKTKNVARNRKRSSCSKQQRPDSKSYNLPEINPKHQAQHAHTGEQVKVTMSPDCQVWPTEARQRWRDPVAPVHERCPHPAQYNSSNL